LSTAAGGAVERPDGALFAPTRGNTRGRFVVTGRGARVRQKERKAALTIPKPPTAAGAPGACAGAELHFVGVYHPTTAAPGRGSPADRHSRSCWRCAGWGSVLWKVRSPTGPAQGGHLSAAAGEQEMEGVPQDSRRYRTYDLPRNADYFLAYKGARFDYRRALEKLNDLTGLLVSTFQGTTRGRLRTSWTGCGAASSPRRSASRAGRREEPSPQEFAGRLRQRRPARLGVYQPADEARPVPVELRRTARPIVLALTSYYSVLWKVKIADGARLQGGHPQRRRRTSDRRRFPPTFRSCTGPIVSPEGRDYIYGGYKWKSPNAAAWRRV